MLIVCKWSNGAACQKQVILLHQSSFTLHEFFTLKSLWRLTRFAAWCSKCSARVGIWWNCVRRPQADSRLFSIYRLVLLSVFALGCAPRWPLPAPRCVSSQQDTAEGSCRRLHRRSSLLSHLFSDLFDEARKNGHYGKTAIPGNIGPVLQKELLQSLQSPDFKVDFQDYQNLNVSLPNAGKNTPQLVKSRAPGDIPASTFPHFLTFLFQDLCTELKPCREDLSRLVIVPAVSARFGEPWQNGKEKK